MDESFFAKYALQIKKRNDSKDEIINYIKEKTGILLESETITLSQKKITFQISSVLKQKLFQKNIVKVLEEKGFQVRF
jgi:hypothetical protein